jgi:ABC-type transporter MlaC component
MRLAVQFFEKASGNILATVFMAYCTFSPALAKPLVSPSPTNIHAAGWSTVQKIVQTFKGSSLFDAQDKAGRAAMAELIDFNQIARRALNASEWQALTAQEKQELAGTIQTLLERRYYPRWKKIFGKGEVFYSAENKNGPNKNDIFVATTLRLGTKEDPLTWQLSSDAGKTRVISLAVNKKDLLGTLHQRIEARQVKGGYPAMIAWLKGKGKFESKNASLSDSTADGASDAGDISNHHSTGKQSALAASKNAPKSGSLID